jgi:TonB family protein
MKLLTAFLLLSLAGFGATPEPYLRSAPMPFYPQLCRRARIQGEVIVHFTINGQGDSTDVTASNGHQLLREAAIHEVQSWKFGWVHPCDCRVKRQVVLVYKISGDWVDDNGPTTVVKWFGKAPVTKVEIQAGGVSVQTSHSDSKGKGH